MAGRKIIVYKEVITVSYEPIEVDEDEPVSVTHAAKISGRTQPTISNSLSSGKLTTVYYRNPATLPEGITQDRLALKSEVEMFP